MTNEAHLRHRSKAETLQAQSHECTATIAQSASSVPTTQLPAWLPTPRPDARYWLLSANPHGWSYEKYEVEEEFSLSLTGNTGRPRKYQDNYLKARAGDVVLCRKKYRGGLTALAVVSRAQDGEAIYFKLLKKLACPIEHQKLKEIDVKSLKDMEEQGSFLPVTPKEYANVVHLIATNLEAEEAETSTDAPCAPYGEADFLRDVWMSEDDLRKLKGLLLHKKNVILQGPPGVGKTYAAKRLAWALAGEKDKARVRCVQFHQSYSYEDFVWGFKPKGEGFVGRNGVFAAFCRRAAEDPEKPYFFLIDEINRGNLSKILGEALMLIEADHRGEALRLASRRKPFVVPENLYIIGMMNTADRSIAIIDYALRRRFGFFTVRPAFDSDGFQRYANRLKQAIALAEVAEKARPEKDGLKTSVRSERFDRLRETILRLNETIRNDPTLGKGFEIGHSFLAGAPLMATDSQHVGIDLDAFDVWFANLINYELLPLLEEYWYDDDGKLELWTKSLKDLSVL